MTQKNNWILWMVGQWSSCRIMKKFGVVQSMLYTNHSGNILNVWNVKAMEHWKQRQNFLGQILSNHHKATQNILGFLGRIIEKSYYMFLQCWKHKHQLRIFGSSTVFSQCLQPNIGNCLLCWCYGSMLQACWAWSINRHCCNSTGRGSPC